LAKQGNGGVAGLSQQCDPTGRDGRTRREIETCAGGKETIAIRAEQSHSCVSGDATDLRFSSASLGVSLAEPRRDEHGRTNAGKSALSYDVESGGCWYRDVREVNAFIDF
jgi:hypothetical protein